MFDGRLRLSNQVAAEVRRYFGDRVFEAVVQRNVRVSEAPSFGKPVLLYDAVSSGSKNYMALAGEVIRNNQRYLEEEATSEPSDGGPLDVAPEPRPAQGRAGDRPAPPRPPDVRPPDARVPEARPSEARPSEAHPSEARAPDGAPKPPPPPAAPPVASGQGDGFGEPGRVVLASRATPGRPAAD